MKSLILFTISFFGLVFFKAETNVIDVRGIESDSKDTLQSQKLYSGGYAYNDFDELIKGFQFCSLPAQEIYDDWNTTTIHPYKFDPGKFNDTICLDLIKQGDCEFVTPRVGRVSSKFGWRRYRYHYGIDISLYTGDSVRSAFDGVVRIARYSTSYGYFVVVRHYNGLETLYAHLSRLKVKTGDEVEAGDLIGKGGRTGRATGSHLHFEVRYKGWPLNPAEFIDFTTGKLIATSFELTPEKLSFLTKYTGHKYYTSSYGESLEEIATKNRIRLSYLCKINDFTSNYIPSEGEKIRVR
jgi:murein DD-endopeptidase MepM/ murein hydrolase activator NlpD